MSREFDVRTPKNVNKALNQLAEARVLGETQVDVNDLALSAAALGFSRTKLWRVYTQADRWAQKMRDSQGFEPTTSLQSIAQVEEPTPAVVHNFPQVTTLRVSPNQPLQPWHDQEQVFTQRY